MFLLYAIIIISSSSSSSSILILFHYYLLPHIPTVLPKAVALFDEHLQIFRLVRRYSTLQTIRHILNEVDRSSINGEILHSTPPGCCMDPLRLLRVPQQRIHSAAGFSGSMSPVTRRPESSREPLNAAGLGPPNDRRPPACMPSGSPPQRQNDVVVKSILHP